MHRLAMRPMTVATKWRGTVGAYFIRQEVGGVGRELCQRVDTVSAWVARRAW